MKKMGTLILLMVFVTVALAVSQNFKVGYSGPQGQGDIIYTKASDGSTQLRLGTTSAVAVDTITHDGKYGVTGPDATTGLMMQIGSCTNGQTITFSPVFAATPRIVGSYSEDAGADTAIEFVGTTATSTVVQAASAKTIDFIVVGARP